MLVLNREVRIRASVAAAATDGFSAVDEEKPELDAHEHGHPALNIAIEGDKV